MTTTSIMSKTTRVLHFLGILLSFSSLAVSCSNDTPEIKEADLKHIRTLRENIARIQSPESFDVNDGGMVVLSDNENVYLYGQDGNQIRKIGNAGRARHEYFHPSIVRFHKDTVFVWSSFTACFISYSLDGTPIKEYEYKSAIRDFAVTDESIVIYTAGLRTDYVIDILDKSTDTITRSLTESTPEHRVLSRLRASMPLLAVGEKIYHSPKDCLGISVYDSSSGENVEGTEFGSNTFNVAKVPDNGMENDRAFWDKYVDENSHAIGILARDDGKISLMTYEGITTTKNEEVDLSRRFISVYDISSKSPISRYSYSSFGESPVMRFTENGLYVLCHSIENDNDVYTLKKLVI